MTRALWTYMGKIDCYGIHPQQRDKLFAAAQAATANIGGELQLAAAQNLFDTDRYDLYFEAEHDTPLRRLLIALTHLLPEPHRPFTLEGYDRVNLTREDLTVRDHKLIETPYLWAPAAEHVVQV